MGQIHIGRGHGIDIREEDGTEYIYLSPSHAGLNFTKMTLDGEVVWQKGQKLLGELSGKYPGRYCPTNISFSPDGGYFLGDGYGGSYIHQFDAKDNYLAYNRWSRVGGRTVSNASRPMAGRPRRYAETRRLRPGQQAPPMVRHEREASRTQGGFLFPADVDIQGDIMLVPDLHARITLLDKENKVITHLGDDESWREKALSKGFRTKRAEWKDGHFVHPHDACFDKNGNVFCAEWVTGGRVTKLTKV